MAAHTKTIKSIGSKLGFSSRLAFLGDTCIFIAPKGTDADPFDAGNWVLLGVVDGEAEINPNIEKFEVITGSPRTRKTTIKTGQLDSMTATFSHLTLAGLSLLKTGSTTNTFTAASDGQTAVATGGGLTNFTTTVDAATNIAEGDLCIVNNTIKEMVFVESISSDTITHSLLSQIPADATTFLKVDGTSTTASGVKFSLADGACFSEFELIVVRYFGCSKNMMIEHRPRAIPIPQGGIKVSPTAPATGTIMFDFIDSTSDTVIYGNDYLVPTES